MEKLDKKVELATVLEWLNAPGSSPTNCYSSPFLREILICEKDVNKKCEDYLRWDDYFMALASLASKRSKDPNTKVGACVVNQDLRVVALGYNGMPNGCDDEDMPWGRTGKWEETKYPFVCHAEMNAIMNKTSADLKNCVIYTTLFPCNECAKLIIQSGIEAVYYLSNKDFERPTYAAARRLFDVANIRYSQHIPRRSIVLDFDVSHCDDPDSNSSERSPISTVNID